MRHVVFLASWNGWFMMSERDQDKEESEWYQDLQQKDKRTSPLQCPVLPQKNKELVHKPHFGSGGLQEDSSNVFPKQPEKLVPVKISLGYGLQPLFTVFLLFLPFLDKPGNEWGMWHDKIRHVLFRIV